jgi:hypothetical protein
VATNHHGSAAPVIEERPGRYLGYFENKFGEQLVFVHDDGEPDATPRSFSATSTGSRVASATRVVCPDAGDQKRAATQHNPAGITCANAALDQESYRSRPFSTRVPQSPGAQRAFVGGAGRRGPPTCGGRAIWVGASRSASRMSIPSGMTANASG